MRNIAFMALAALVASPVFGSTAKRDSALTAGGPVDMLYPEIAVDDDGWRGLLPVILIKTEEVSEDQPAPPAHPTTRSEQSKASGS
jgi:hypothetical protein